MNPAFNPFRDCGPRQSKKHPTAYKKDELVAIAISKGVPKGKAQAMTVGKLCNEIAIMSGVPTSAAINTLVAAQPKFVPGARFVPVERVPQKRRSAPDQLEGRPAPKGKYAIAAGFKAPGAKRGPSVYNLYMARELPKYKASHPGVAHTTAFTAVAHQWKYAPENPKRVA